MEIEAPTPDQKAEAMSAEIIAFAETGVADDKIVSKLMAKGVSRTAAEKLLPGILETSEAKRRRRYLVRKIGGSLLAVGGIGSGVYLLTVGVIFIWPFVVGFAGLAIYAGYLDHFLDIHW